MGVQMTFNPYEEIEIEETLDSEYEDYLDHFRVNWIPVVSDSKVCPKCGESITEFEVNINDNVCPCCDTILFPRTIKEDGWDLTFDIEDDIPI